MEDSASLVQQLSMPLKSGSGWMKFLATLTIIGGVLQVLSIIGILWAWLPIWLGVVLFQAASGMDQAAISGDQTAFLNAQGKLRLYFMIQAIVIIIAFALVILFFLFGGMALLAGLAHRSLPSATL